MVLALLMGWAMAAPTPYDTSSIEADLQAHVLSPVDALYLRYLAHFEPESLPERYASAGDHPGWTCGLGLVQDLEASWDAFSEAQRDDMRSRVFLDGLAPDDAAGPPASGSCWGLIGDAVGEVTTENFSVQYESGVSPDYASQFADSLEYALQAHGDNGWKRPNLLGSFKMTAYIQDARNYAGAYTTVANCGNAYMAYIVAGSGSFWDGAWYRDMAGHELMHAVQFAYGFGHQFWYWEASATYSEEYTYPTHNDWATNIPGFVDKPHISMMASDQNNQDIFWHMYGGAIWNFYLDQHHGGLELVQDIWKVTEGHLGQYDITPERAVLTVGYDFRELYKGFIATNTVMDYDDRAYYSSVAIQRTITDFPATGQSSFATRPQGYGQNYIEIDSKDLPRDEDLTLDFAGDAAAGDWMVLIVGTNGYEVVDIVEVPIEGGVGSAVLEHIGDYIETWVVVSPLVWSETGFNYSYEVDLVPSEPEPDPDTDPDSDADTGPDTDLVKGACGCAVSGPTASWLLLPIAAVLVTRRRRLKGSGSTCT